MNETEKTNKELGEIIAKALGKLGNGDCGFSAEADKMFIGGDELTILFFNKRIVAFTTWNYDGTWFGVVDLEKKEALLSSMDSVMSLEEDRLILYTTANGSKEVVTCFFCKKASTLRQAIDKDWIPYFYARTGTEAGPVCPDCIDGHITVEKDGEWVEL